MPSSNMNLGHSPKVQRSHPFNPTIAPTKFSTRPATAATDKLQIRNWIFNPEKYGKKIPINYRYFGKCWRTLSYLVSNSEL